MGSGKKNIDKNKIGQQTPPQPPSRNIGGHPIQNTALAFVGFNGVKKNMPIFGKPHHTQGGVKPNIAATAANSKPNTAQSNGSVVKSAKSANKPPKTTARPAKIPAQTATPAPAASSVNVMPPILGTDAQIQSGVDGINGDANVIQDDDALLAQILEQKRILDEQIAALLSMKKKPNFP